MSLIPPSIAPVRALALAWRGGNLDLKLRLQAPKSGKTSSLEKLASMSMRRSLARVAPLKAPLLVTGPCRKEAPLEIVRDSEETLVISTERRLLDWVSIRILSASLLSSPLRLKWLCKTRVDRLPVEIVSSSEESSPWDVA